MRREETPSKAAAPSAFSTWFLAGGELEDAVRLGFFMLSDE
jgi:hypothetical protein